MSFTADILDKLEYELSRLSTEDEKKTAVRRFHKEFGASIPRDPLVTRTLTSHGGNISLIGQQTDDGADVAEGRFFKLLDSHELTPTFAHALFSDYTYDKGRRQSHVLERAPCANVNPDNFSICTRDGISACSGCKIVGYCSKECQTQHWKTHKRDCKDPVGSLDWQPAWTVENRVPAFMGRSGPSYHPLSVGEHLWGNMPSIDTINLAKNEGIDYPNDLDVMFAASGDMRNLIKTVNGLPLDFAGHVTIVLNDRNPRIVMRNFALLLLLGYISSAELAADLTLHMWYSAFVPDDYIMRATMAIMDWAQKCAESMDNFRFPLTTSSEIRGSFDPMLVRYLLESVSSTYSTESASNELTRVRFASDRNDYHHRRYLQLEPNHRIACSGYRRSGLVLPFAASNASFNQPNRLLFDLSGRWTQRDHADPLEGFHIPDVIASGKSHGALPGDLYGCLYFHLSDQLRAFSERLSKLRITIQLFNVDASQFGNDIQAGAYVPYGLSSRMKFDRIDLSNIIDPEYVGLQRCLKVWGPLLKPQKHATLSAYSMNWPIHEKGANVDSLDDNMRRSIIRRFIESGQVPVLNKIKGKKSLPDMVSVQNVSIACMQSMNILLDSSAAFERFMKKQGVDMALRQSGLKLKTKHTIVPHRIGIPLNAAKNKLPSFADDRDWYLQVCVGLVSWTERFLEFQAA